MFITYFKASPRTTWSSWLRLRRVRRILIATLVSLSGLAILRVALWHPHTVAGTPPPDRYARLSGVVHVHTRHSDGGGTVKEVSHAAKTAGLDYVIITDHNNLDGKLDEGYASGVLVIVGTELSTESGHILGLGFPEPTFRFSGDTLDTLGDIYDLGGVGFAAHPNHPRPDLRWTGWEFSGPWGIEILNGDAQWRAAGWGGTIRAALTYPLNPVYALLKLLSHPEATLRHWDQLLVNRNVAVLAGTDAHSYVSLAQRIGVRFPSYESMFRLMQNHILLTHPLSGDAAADGAAIVASLAHGRGYVGLDGLAPASGFSFVAERGDQQWTMGDAVPLSPPPILRAGGDMPRGAILSLFRNGRVVAEDEGSVTLAVTRAGTYRVEVHLPEVKAPWIVSNPIYVFDAATHQARRQKALWPPVPPLPASTRLLDDFGSDSVFEPVFDVSTVLSPDIIDPQGGADGTGAAQLKFKLGIPGIQTESPFFGLASSKKWDLSGSRGFLVSIKGNDIHRIWLQVRDENPNSDEGAEWWFASVRTSRQWRRVAVPFSRFRTRDPNTDGQLDLDQTVGILFTVDSGVAKPGAEGVIWIDALETY